MGKVLKSALECRMWDNDWISPQDDGFVSHVLGFGQSASYTLLNTGDYAGSTQVSVGITPKSEYISNNCVQDNQTGLMWLANHPVALGPNSDGMLCWNDRCDTIEMSSRSGDFEVTESVVQATTSYSAEIRHVWNNDSYNLMCVINSSNRPFDTAKVITGQSSSATCVVDSYRSGNAEDLWEYAYKCNVAEVAGHSDWRVPSLAELASIVQLKHTTGDGLPDSDYFDVTDLTDNYVLSSTHGDAKEKRAYLIRFGDRCVTGYRFKSGTVSGISAFGYVYLVRGSASGYGCGISKTGSYQQDLQMGTCDGHHQAGVERQFSLLTTGQYAAGTTWSHHDLTALTCSGNCVQDNNTGLMWTADVVVGANTSTDGLCRFYDDDGKRKDAWNIVRQLNMRSHAGHSDWRIPTAMEAATVIGWEDGNEWGTMPSSYFTNGTLSFWLSTGATDDFTYVHSAHNDSSYWGDATIRTSTTYTRYVRAVRGGNVNG